MNRTAPKKDEASALTKGE